jgi:hypothetical protein
MAVKRPAVNASGLASRNVDDTQDTLLGPVIRHFCQFSANACCPSTSRSRKPGPGAGCGSRLNLAPQRGWACLDRRRCGWKHARPHSFGAVVDFFNASKLGFVWVFNVADASIDVGIGLLLLPQS